mgnify:CR=1 FL=1
MALLASAITTPIMAPLADMFGKRRLLVLSLLAFGLGSAVAALGSSLELVGRACVEIAGGELDTAERAARSLIEPPDTLETLGVFGYRRSLKGQVSTAHPHYDSTRRCHYNYIADFGMSSVYRLDGERLVGVVAARYGTGGADELLVMLSEGTRAP